VLQKKEQLETGARISVISEELYKKLKDTNQLVEMKQILRRVGGNRLDVLGYIQLNLSVIKSIFGEVIRGINRSTL